MSSVQNHMPSWEDEVLGLGALVRPIGFIPVPKVGKRDRVVLTLPPSCDVTFNACCGHLGGSYTSYNRG
jgi:hypothetical protein